MQVICPACRKKGEWFETTSGPFCSERCKLVDLGKWFNAEHAISSPLNPDLFEDYEALENSPDLDKPEA